MPGREKFPQKLFYQNIQLRLREHRKDVTHIGERVDESLCDPSTREGVIIEWPLNDLFNNGGDVIISSRMAVSIIF